MTLNRISSLPLLLIAACSTTPATTGRYLQVRHPMTDAVIAQLTYPTSSGCAFVLQSMKNGNEKAKQGATVSSCRDTAATDLKTRATLRDKPGNYLFDIETAVPFQCGSFVYDVVKESNDTVVVVSDCKNK